MAGKNTQVSVPKNGSTPSRAPVIVEQTNPGFRMPGKNVQGGSKSGSKGGNQEANNEFVFV